MKIEGLNTEALQKLHSDIWRILKLGDFPLPQDMDQYSMLSKFRILLNNHLRELGEIPLTEEYEI